MIKYCTHCGSAVSFKVPSGDSLPRHICLRCGHIHYENPRLVVGCLAEFEGRFLMCRRAIEPRLGLWTLPGGFMENGENTAEAARRETLEEAGAEVLIDAPFAMVSVAHINQVHLFYRGRLHEPVFAAGEESLEAALLSPQDIPWESLAFRTVAFCLKCYLGDMKRGSFGFHESAIAPLPVEP